MNMTNHQRGFGSAYLNSLNQEIGSEHVGSPDLRATLLAWYAGLPEFARERAFSMSEIEAAVGSQGRYISAVLVALGWRRGRKWTSKRHYLRTWVPPTPDTSLPNAPRAHVKSTDW
jgi:hypothetical protein